MTLPRVNKLWLIMPASLARLFSAPLRPIASDPARSTKLSFPTLSRSSPPCTEDSLICTVSEKIECDRLCSGKVISDLSHSCYCPDNDDTHEDSVFILVSATCLLWDPLVNKLNPSLAFRMLLSSNP